MGCAVEAPDERAGASSQEPAGNDEPARGQVEPDGRPGTEGTGPSAQDPPDPGDIVAGRLGFLDVTGDEIREVVAAYGGEIEIDPEGLRIVQVRFPVDDVAELLEIRDELRRQGYRVDVVPANEPGLDADEESFLDVEP